MLLISICVFFLDLSQRVDAVKDENLKLKSENQVIAHGITVPFQKGQE